MNRSLRLGLALLIAGAASAPCASAQTTAENVAKYDSLRDRLNREFIILGEAQGEGMPAHIRHDDLGYIRWADATVDLGWYIGVLATEHALLNAPARFPGLGRDVSQTEDELYFALAAMERLDRVANAVFDAPCTMGEELDGFFIRDDVPADFHTRFGLMLTRSDFIDGPTLKEMSQDQVWHVMMGLALVSRLVPAGTTVRGRDLPSWALEQLARIMTHVEASGEWIITNPACDGRNVARGSVAAGYALGATRAMEFLTDGAVTYPINRFQTGLWATLTNPDNAAYSNSDNLHMAMVVAAVGGGFGLGTSDHLALLAERHGWWAYPLLHAVLHGEEGAPAFCATRDRVNAGARTMLDELPTGAEPSSPQPDRGPHQFTSSNRFIRPIERAYVGSPGSQGERYHGLDFMLLHNLYALATPSEWDGSDAPAPGVCDPPILDAGPPPQPDGGVSPDAGPSSEPDGGCGCRAAPSAAGAAGLMPWLTLLLIVRRRRPPVF